jgi:hypothetical protein
MERRDFVKAAVSAAAAAAMSQRGVSSADVQQTVPPATPAAQSANPAAAPPAAAARGGRGGFNSTPSSPATVADLVANGAPHFFSHQQFATLRKLCEVMMPAHNGFPSAVEAGVPEFLDFLVGATPAGWQQSYAAARAGSAPARQVVTGSMDRQHMYMTGLERLENEARRKFSKAFSGLHADEADALLVPALAPWMADHPPQDPFRRFINIAHQDIRTATMNSAAWSEAAVAVGEREPGIGLYWSPIDPRIERNR